MNTEELTAIISSLLSSIKSRKQLLSLGLGLSSPYQSNR